MRLLLGNVTKPDIHITHQHSVSRLSTVENPNLPAFQICNKEVNSVCETFLGNFTKPDVNITHQHSVSTAENPNLPAFQNETLTIVSNQAVEHYGRIDYKLWQRDFFI